MNKIYLAGLIDGEGYFGIIPRQPNKIKGGKNVFYQCAFKLALTGLHAQEITQEIADQYKGWVFKRNTPTATGKEVYTVEVKGNQRMIPLLDDILPYLKVKKEQAIIMHEFVHIPQQSPRYKRFDESLFTRKGELAKELKSYTQRIPLAETK